MQTDFKFGNRADYIHIGNAGGNGYEYHQRDEFLFESPRVGVIIIGVKVRKNHILQRIQTVKHQNIIAHHQRLMKFVKVDKSERLKDISQRYLNEYHPDKINLSPAA